MVRFLKAGVVFGLGVIAALVWVACSSSSPTEPSKPPVPKPPVDSTPVPKPPAPPPVDTTPVPQPPPPIPWQHDPPIGCAIPDSVPVAPDTVCILSIITWPDLNVTDTTHQIQQFCAFAKMGRPRGIAPQVWPTSSSQGIVVCDSVARTLPGWVGG